MRILQINKFFYLRGGAERHYLELSHALQKQGHEIVSFSMHDPRNNPSEYSDYFVSEIDYSNVRDVKTTLKAVGRTLHSFEAVNKLTALIKATKPDIAHVHLLYNHLPPSLIRTIRSFGIPVVFTVHDWYALCPNYSLWIQGVEPEEYIKKCRKGACHTHLIFERAIKNSFLMSALASLAGSLFHARGLYKKEVDHFVAPSAFVKKLFIRYGFDREKITVLPHFVSPDFLSGLNVKEKNALVGSKKDYFLYAGRLSPEKGIDRLVEYWGKKKIPYELRIAGKGPLEPRLIELIRFYDLGRRVRLVGFAQTTQLASLMHNARSVIAPSIIHETFGLSLVEAWSQGTSVIASNKGPFPELIRASGGGVLFAWEKDDSLKNALESAMGNLKRANDLGRLGFLHVQNYNTIQKYIDRILRLYQDVLDSSLDSFLNNKK